MALLHNRSETRGFACLPRAGGHEPKKSKTLDRPLCLEKGKELHESVCSTNAPTSSEITLLDSSGWTAFTLGSGRTVSSEYSEPHPCPVP